MSLSFFFTKEKRDPQILFVILEPIFFFRLFCECNCGSRLLRFFSPPSFVLLLTFPFFLGEGGERGAYMRESLS